jgi:RNA polymerase sigma-70 factor (ECF subfamily)
LSKFNGKAKFSSWLYRIAYNQFLQHCRKNQAQKNFAEFEDVEEEDYQAPSEIVNDDSEGQLHKQLANLLSQLEPERRSVLHLLLHRQYTQQEIATIMGIPLGTVKTHISRGRSELQKQLSHWQE